MDPFGGLVVSSEREVRSWEEGVNVLAKISLASLSSFQNEHFPHLK